MSVTLLADHVFMIVHDEVTGKAAVNPELLGSGLAGGLLGELLLFGRIAVVNNVVVLRDTAPTGEPALDRLVQQLGRQDGEHLVRTWVEHLRDSATETVADRLLSARVVRAERSRSLLGRTSTRYLAVDPLSSSGSRALLAGALERGDALPESGAAIAGLVGAMQAEQVLMLMWSRARHDAAIQVLVDGLLPDLQGIVGGVRAAVAASALTVRR